MKIFGSHSQPIENGKAGESYEDPQNPQLKKIKTEIDELKDTKADGSLDTSNDKIEIQGTLNREFAEYLKSKPEIANALNDAIQNIKVTDENKQAIEDLKNFLEPIIRGAFRSEFKINDMSKIQESNDKGGFANKVDEAVDGQTSKIDNLKLSINGYLSNYSDILSTETDIKNTLEKVKMVLENPVSTNVKILQNIIYDNLTETDQKKFLAENKNKKNYSEADKFDGKFGNYMVEWTDKGLKIIEKHLKSLKSAKDVMDKNETENTLSQIKPKSDIKADKDSDPNSWFDGLPDGYSVDFESDVEKAKLNTPSNEEVVVRVNIKQGDEIRDTREISLIVVDKVGVNPDQIPEPVNTTPLYYGDGNKYQVMKNNSELIGSTKIGGATFYSCEAVQNVPQNDDGTRELADDELAGSEREFYMKLSNRPNDLYKVKIDKDGNLCPIAMEISKELNNRDGSDAEIPVLLKNKESCMRYLHNKLPVDIEQECAIGWNEQKQDYVLQSHDRWLTVEPMTIAGNWISKDLGRNLAFLNLTNYLRQEGASRGKGDLDVSRGLRVKGIKNVKEKLFIDRRKFGLDAATPEELSNFKKYNNGEQWNNPNWDAKRQNIVYKKIDI